MKTCSACKVAKPLSEFHRHATAPDGRNCYCKSCAIAKVALWQKANPERRRINARKYHVKRRDSGQVREDKFKIRYGITVADYDKKFEAQGGLCAVCRRPPPLHNLKTFALGLDHDHKTLVNRGLLCQNCNAGLGMFGDSIELMESAIAYLQQYGGQ
jgi:hypothetical protein